MGQYQRMTDDRLNEVANEFRVYAAECEAKILIGRATHLVYEDLTFYYHELSVINHIRFERAWQAEHEARMQKGLETVKLIGGILNA